MKKTITKEIPVCDFCSNEEETFSSCNHCQKDVCYSCHKHKFITLKYAVNFIGSLDGEYCQECFDKLKASRQDKLFNAYLKLQNIIEEFQEFHQPWKQRAKQAEEEIRYLWNQSKGGIK